MEANNEFTETLEKRLQDVPRSDELNEIKKVVRKLKLGLKMAQDRERAMPPNWLSPKSWVIRLLRSKLVCGL